MELITHRLPYSLSLFYAVSLLTHINDLAIRVDLVFLKQVTLQVSLEPYTAHSELENLVPVGLVAGQLFCALN